MVDEVRRKDSKVFIVVGGKVVEPDSITAVHILDHDDDCKPLSADASVHLIGKTVDIDLSRISIKNGHGQITYCNNTDQTSAHIEITDTKSHKLITEFDCNLKKNDKGSSDVLKFDATERGVVIADGSYSCSIVLKQDDDASGVVASVTLPKTINAEVLGVNLLTKEVTTNAGKYNTANIVSIGSMSSYADTSLMQQGGLHIGKYVTYENSEFDYDSVTQFVTDIRIPKPAQGNKLGDATLRVYEKDRMIAEVVEAQVYHCEEEALPTFHDLDQASKTAVEQHLNTQLLTKGRQNYTNMNAAERLKYASIVAPFIATGFRGGELFKQGQTAVNKLKNMGVVQISWNGQKLGGQTARAGTYRYEVITTECDSITGAIATTNKTSAHARSTVTSTEVRGGVLYLNLANGKSIEHAKIIEVTG